MSTTSFSMIPLCRSLCRRRWQVGWDTDDRLVSDRFAEQFEQALRNCVAVVVAAGGRSEDIVRLTMFCVDRRAYQEARQEIGIAYRRVMGVHYPAMSLLEVRALLEEKALVEIEATAAIPVSVDLLKGTVHS